MGIDSKIYKLFISDLSDIINPILLLKFIYVNKNKNIN